MMAMQATADGGDASDHRSRLVLVATIAITDR